MKKYILRIYESVFKIEIFKEYIRQSSVLAWLHVVAFVKNSNELLIKHENN